MKPTPETLDRLRLLRQTKMNGYAGKTKAKVIQPTLPVVSTKLLAASIAANELQGYYNQDEVLDVLAALAHAVPRIMLEGREIHINNLGKFKYRQTKGSFVTHANTGKIKLTAANFSPVFKFVDELKREISYKFKHALQLAGKIETDQYLLARLETAAELSKSGIENTFHQAEPEIVIQDEEKLSEVHSYTRKTRISKMLTRLKAERDKAKKLKEESGNAETTETTETSVVNQQQHKDSGESEV